MTDKPSHIELAYATVGLFANDGTLDVGELNFLLGIALRDGEMSDKEKRVLETVFNQVDCSKVSTVVAERIAAVRKKHGID